MKTHKTSRTQAISHCLALAVLLVAAVITTSARARAGSLALDFAGNAGGVFGTGYTTVLPANRTADASRLRLGVATSGAYTGSKYVDRAHAQPGDLLTYTIVATNSSSLAIFEILDPIPLNTTYVADSIRTSTGSILYDEALKRVQWVGALDTAQSVTLTFQVVVNQLPLHSLAVINQAVLRNTLTNFPVLMSAITAIQAEAADLSNSEYSASPQRVMPHESLTFSLRLTNSGSGDAENASVRLSLPHNTRYLASSATSGTLVYDQASSELRWSAAGPLSPGASLTISLFLRTHSVYTEGYQFESTAEIVADSVQPYQLTAAATLLLPSHYKVIYVPLAAR